MGSIQAVLPKSIPCKEFPTQIRFDDGFPDCEIVKRGFC